MKQIILSPKTAKARSRSGKNPVIVTIEQEDSTSLFVRFPHIRYWTWIRKNSDPNWDIGDDPCPADNL